MEKAILKAYTADEIESMDLRVGTVHAFQGNERDLVIASMGVGDDNPAGWRFVEDPSLAAVLLTRARRHLVVVYSGAPPERGLIADFLQQENTPPGRSAPREPASAWARSIRDGAALAGVVLWPGYPSGRHDVDLVLGDTTRDVAVECDIHPSGPASHIRRRLEMMDRGWEFFEALRSQWIDREAELVVDLVNRLKH
jgi:hypothetical protein